MLQRRKIIASPSPPALLTSNSDKPQSKPLTTQTFNYREEGIDDGASIRDGRERIYLNDRYIVYARTNCFEVLCFGESSKHMDQSGSFFNIGSLEVVGGAEYCSFAHTSETCEIGSKDLREIIDEPEGL